MSTDHTPLRSQSGGVPAPAADGISFESDAIEILERIDEGFYAIDVEWRFAYANQAAERFWGRNRDELLGAPCSEYYQPRDSLYVLESGAGAIDVVIEG